ncbi:MAG: cyclic nucleotide-binding domain-containing protein [Polyangiaceae bacterium]
MAREERAPHLDARRILDLRSLPIFRDAPAPVVNGAATLLRDVTFSRGECIQAREAPVERVLFLQRGTVAVAQPEKKIILIEPPAQLGLFYALAGTPARVDVTAQTEVRALALESRDMVDLFEDQFSLLRSTLRETARVALKESRSKLTTPFEFARTHWKQSSGEPRLDLVDRLFFLREMLSFPGASIDALASVARQMQSRRVKAGEVIWHQGDPALEMYLIASGEVEAKSETESLIHSAGGPLGGLEVFAQAPRWYDLTARTDGLVLTTTHEAFLDMIEEHTEMGSELIAGMARTVLQLRAGALDIRTTTKPTAAT